MTFSISFLDVPEEYLDDDPALPSAIGEIRIGEFAEEFVSPLRSWNRQRYIDQWTTAMDQLLSGVKKSALITAYYGEDSWNLQWWPIFLDGETVKVHNQILCFDNLDKPFSITDFQDSVADYRSVNEEGQIISNWKTSLKEIRTFRDSLVPNPR